MILAKRPEVDRFLKSPDRGVRAAVIHGKDRSGVGERAEILCKAITPDLNDPFNVTLLTDSDIDGDGARLEEALTALSMIGGRRLVRVRLGSEKVAVDKA
ncbi:MAG: DNA polymerase III subunit delta, partial [bacterium]